MMLPEDALRSLAIQTGSKLASGKVNPILKSFRIILF